MQVEKASLDDLTDKNILCVEAGGSGLVHLHDFDHHDPAVSLPPACKQAYDYFRPQDAALSPLVKYVSLVDQARPAKVDFPSLSNIFSGMLLVTADPAEQIHKGLDILRHVKWHSMDPLNRMPELSQWEPYIEAKHQNFKVLQEDFKHIKLFSTSQGLKCGFLSTKAVGGFYKIYAMGCDIGIIHNPAQKKYTIGSRKWDLTELLKTFQSIERGWKGRKDIFGSPYGGSNLRPEDVINIVCKGSLKCLTSL